MSTLIRSMPHTIHVYLAENTPICRMVLGKIGQRKASRPRSRPTVKLLTAFQQYEIWDLIYHVNTTAQGGSLRASMKNRQQTMNRQHSYFWN